jgi:hypothetical protein
MNRQILLLPLLVALLAAPASAQKKNTAQGPFAAVTSFTCSFPIYATASVTDPSPRVTSSSEDFGFQIRSIDYKRRNAQIVAGANTALAAIVLTQTGLNVIEQTAMGNLNVTTIFAAGGTDQHFPAVHSRHIGDVTAPPSVSQHYGSCDAGK